MSCCSVKILLVRIDALLASFIVHFLDQHYFSLIPHFRLYYYKCFISVSYNIIQIVFLL